MRSSAQQTLTVVITGASAGLGRAIACEFGRAGARIGLISRDHAALESAAAEVNQLGGTAATYAADVGDSGAIEGAAAHFEEHLGPIDVWVNNAMVFVFSPIKEMEAAEYRRVTEVNYLGYVHGTLAALKRMLPRDRGRIIQIGSALAFRSIPLQSAYCATKHAIVGFTDSLRQPVPPIYKPEVGAKVVVHAALAKSPRREYWVGGSTVKAIVGQKLIPGSLDVYLGKTGYKAQQLKTPDSPDRPHNLYQPVVTSLGAHGPFEARSRPFSLEAEISKHRGWFVFGCGLIGAAIYVKRMLAR